MKWIRPFVLIFCFLPACLEPCAINDGGMDAVYSKGLLLAKNNQWQEAKIQFERGTKLFPNETRFLTELAGVAFHEGDYRKAGSLMLRVLEKEPDNPYANDFAGTVYLLQGNLEAALQFWNRIGKPEIEHVHVDPLSSFDPVLLDHVFLFAPGEKLELEQLYETQSRIRMLDAFSRVRFELNPNRNVSRFDLLVRPVEKKHTFSSWPQVTAMILQAVLDQTVRPAFHNLRHSAWNQRSLVSWQSGKLRFNGALSLPLQDRPESRISFAADVRNEDWLFPQTATAGFRLFKYEAGMGLQHIVNAKWIISAHVRASRRSYEDVTALVHEDTVRSGWVLKTGFGAESFIFRQPDKKLMITARSSAELGRLWSGAASPFLKMEQSLEATRGSAALRLRAGFLAGGAPVDEWFVLGRERDTDLLLRAHNGMNEPMGTNPVGRKYLLSNIQVGKKILHSWWATWTVVPFLDTGKMYDAAIPSQPNPWLWDTGVESRVRVVGQLDLVVTWAKNLRTGSNHVYFSAEL